VNGRTGAVVARAVELAVTSATRRKGLLGRDGLEPGGGLVIAPCSSIHMFFMRFAIDAVFVDRTGRVVKIVRNLKPWRLAVSLGAYAVIELAAGSVGSDLFVGDRLYLDDGPAQPPTQPA
jgi:hypothetical protein